MRKNRRIYLDNCCFNRPYDDQTQIRIEIETKAKLYVQSLIVKGVCQLVVSYILEFENAKNPYLMRKTAIADFFKFAILNVEASEEVIYTANRIKKMGIETKDALHLAAAISAQCDYFLTTDDRVLKYSDTEIAVINPVDFLKHMEALYE